MSQANRKPKAKFRVGQVVMHKGGEGPVKIVSMEMRQGWRNAEFFVYGVSTGKTFHEITLRPLTARERGGR